MVKVIGITGGVGSGKSTVLRLIEQKYNACIIMADDVARELMEKGRSAYLQVVEFFGEDILDADGSIDRAVLADIVFNNKNKLMVLNSIVHPLVKKDIIELITKLRISEEYDYVLVEAALLLDDHYDVFMDEVWYIYTDEAVRRQRLKTGRGYSDEKIDSVMKNQMSDEEFKKKCDIIIDNSKTEQDTLRQLSERL